MLRSTLTNCISTDDQGAVGDADADDKDDNRDEGEDDGLVAIRSPVPTKRH